MFADIPTASVCCDAKQGQEGAAGPADTANVICALWTQLNARRRLRVRDRAGEAEHLYHRWERTTLEPSDQDIAKAAHFGKVCVFGVTRGVKQWSLDQSMRRILDAC